VWAGLLIGSSLAPAFVVADESTSDLYVHNDDGFISLSAQNVPAQDVLLEIATQSDLKLVQRLVLDRDISLTVERQGLTDVLGLILENDSYQLYQGASSEDDSGPGEAIPGVLWVFSEGSALAPAATAFFETVIFLGDIGAKKEAIRELRRLGTRDAVQTLSLALGDEDARVRNAAIEALSRIGGDEALAAIASAAMHEDARIRGKAADALATVGGYSSAEYLNLALYDEDPNVRASVIDSLGDLGDEQSIQTIRRALLDPDPAVRERAVEVLDELEDDAAFRALFPPD
jgi:hypothetical protein